MCILSNMLVGLVGAMWKHTKQNAWYFRLKISMVVSRTPLDARLGELRIRELMGESIYRIGKGGRHSRSACALRPFDCRLFASLLYVMHIPNATVRVSPRVYLSYSHYTYLDGRSREDGYVNISLERTFLSGSIHHVQFDITSSEQHHPSSVVRPTVANFEKMEYSKARERQREREREQCLQWQRGIRSSKGIIRIRWISME